LTKIKSHVLYLTSLGGNFLLSKKIIERTKTPSLLFVWNPGKGELKKGLTAFKKIFPAIDIFNINREEAELLTKKKEIKEMFNALGRKKGVTIITDGPRGAYASDGGKVWRAATTGARSISRTGAGDAFGSGFVAGYLKYDEVKKALAVGMVNAEAVIQKVGAKAGLLTNWPKEKELAKIKITKN
jgi:sugar/nucleoside kinase (ribokinase family)